MSSGLSTMPPLRLAPGVPRWEEVGSLFGGGKGTGSWDSAVWPRPPGADGLLGQLVLSSCSSPPSWFQVKITLGLGLVFCF